MIGQPKFKYGDNVKFNFNNDIIEGIVYIVDKYGTFEDDSDVSYDIYVKENNILYKHVNEKLVNSI